MTSQAPRRPAFPSDVDWSRVAPQVAQNRSSGLNVAPQLAQRSSFAGGVIGESDLVSPETCSENCAERLFVQHAQDFREQVDDRAELENKELRAQPPGPNLEGSGRASAN